MSDNIDYRNEQLLVSYVLHNPSKLHEVDPGLFVSPISKAVYHACKETVDKSLTFNFDTLTSIARTVYAPLGPEDTKMIFDSFSEFENLNHHIELQKNQYLKKVELHKILEDIHVEQSKKGKVNEDFLKKSFQKGLSILDGQNKGPEILSAKGWMDKHRQGDEARQRDLKPKTIGWKLLDNLIKRPLQAGEITTVAAPPGMGKSIFILNAIRNLVSKETPVLSINTEMGEVANADRFIALWGGITTDSIIQRGRSESVSAKIESIRKEIELNPYIEYCSEESLFLSDFDKMILQAKERFMDTGVWDNDNPYMVVTLDLFELLMDIKVKDTGTLSRVIDDMHRIIKKHTINGLPFVALVIVTQVGENLFRDTSFKKQFKTMDDLNDFTFTVADIYGTAGFSQRSRTVILLTRTIVLKRYWFAKEAETLDPNEDIMLINVGKNNHNRTGVLPMWFNDETGVLMPRPQNAPYVPSVTNSEAKEEPKKIIRREIIRGK